MVAALVDTNGDCADIDLDVYRKDADGAWNEISSSVMGDTGGFVIDRMAGIVGRADPGLVVDIQYAGRRHSVVASASGWWLFVAVADPSSDGLPCWVGARPATP